MEIALPPVTRAWDPLIEATQLRVSDASQLDSSGLQAEGATGASGPVCGEQSWQ